MEYGNTSVIDESANYSLNMQYDDLQNIQNKAEDLVSSINVGSSYNNAYANSILWAKLGKKQSLFVCNS